jgi:uncharacterized protein
VTGQSGGREGLMRFVAGPDGRVVPDIAERLPGRGVWLTPRRDIVETAMRKGAFARGLKTRALADAAIADEIEAMLVRRVLELIGLSRRAGEAVTGYEKTRAMLAAGRAGLLLHARDGSMDGLAKLGRTDGVTVVRLFDGDELGRPFGRDRAVHAALARGRLAESVERECRRLAGFRGQTGDVVVTMEGRSDG